MSADDASIRPMSEEPTSGGFVSGGYKPEKVAPPVLPALDKVEHGTIYQDENGTLWKAYTRTSAGRSSAWVPVQIVTADQHRATQRESWAWIANGALAPIVALCWMLGVFTAPLLLIVPLLLAYGGFSLYMLYRSENKLRGQVVAPSAADLLDQGKRS